MTLSFSLRLPFLCLAAFFVIHQLLAWSIALLAPRLVRAAERRNAADASNFLLLWRLAPAMGAFAVSVVVCAPIYFLFEADEPPEKAGPLFLAAALAGGMVLLLSFAKTLWVVLDSSRYVRDCERASEVTCVAGKKMPLWMVDDPSLLFLVAGVLRPRLVISRLVVETLSAEQLDVAFEHERAHLTSRDNLKRLLILLSPSPVFFAAGIRRLEREWGRFIEWAADDKAIAGNPRRSVALADALVQFRRAGMCAPQLNPLMTPLTTGGDDLRMRVNRLLRESEEPATRTGVPRSLLSVAGLALAVILAGSLFARTNPARSLYLLLEEFHGKDSAAARQSLSLPRK
jgi:hypothetical protein